MNRDKVFVGDFTGDGRADLVTQKNLTLYAYISNQTQPYNGAYQIAQTSLLNGEFGVNVHLGDFNGDGMTDIFNFTNDRPFTYFANGDGTFRKVESKFSVGINAAYMWAGDFNADGKTDILTANGTTPITFKTHFSRGDGTYESPETSSARNGCTMTIRRTASWDQPA